MSNNEIIKNIEQGQLKAEVPVFNTGDTVRVYNKIKEGNRERTQIFEGTVLKIQGGSNRTTFTVRKSLHSPTNAVTASCEERYDSEAELRIRCGSLRSECRKACTLRM